MPRTVLLSLLIAGLALGAPAQTTAPLRFDDRPETIQALLSHARQLVRKKLPYRYGTADPRRGFDCSGFVFHLLVEMHAPHVPRRADALHGWLVERNAFVAIDDDPDLDGLQAGDLLFWSGTYRIDRDITHVMIHLGRDDESGRRWMIGASSRRRGIGVFEFDPDKGDGAGAHFAGFGKTAAFFPRP